MDDPHPDCAAAVSGLIAELAAGSAEDRAVLLNLQEEDRVPESKRAAFHRALSATATGTAGERVCRASEAAQLALPAPAPRPAAICGTWSTYVPLSRLQSYGYLSKVTPPRTAPPPRLRLMRPIGRPAHGADRFFWVTSAGNGDADELRDRLGLCHVSEGEQLYGIQIPMDAAPDRPLHVPTALDSRASPAWRKPDRGHSACWGMSRDLRTDEASEPELLAHPHDRDGLIATLIGPTRRPPA